MKESNINSVENIDNSSSSKSSRFIEETKDAVKKALVTMGIVAGSMGPITTSSVVPASANSINHVATTPTTIKTIGQGTSEGLLTAFYEKNNVSTDHDADNYTAPTNETNPINTKGENGNTTENDNPNIEVPGYKSIEINNISPADILPIIGQVETGDKNVYEHIEHLRVAEATRIRDMMWEYGAGNHSPEEYKQLMNRLNTGMIGENPKGYDNYEHLGGEPSGNPSNHAHNERNILNTLINHSNFKIVNHLDNDYEILYNLGKNNENNINIFGNSTSREGTKDIYLILEDSDINKKLLKLKNFIIFGAGTNIKYGNDGILKNKIYQADTNTDDENGIYGSPSSANSKNDSDIDKHLLVTIGTNLKGNINQTNQFTSSSKYPVGFHDKVLFSGRAFPYLSSSDNKIDGEVGKYATSLTNYVNVAMTDLCFQMKADITDVDELLEMIRSTCLTDYIRFDLNGDGDTDDNYDGQPETQPLQLINPAGFFQKYLMPTNLPTSLRTNETIDLDKGYYHGIIYQIPGAEVNINNQWIAFTDENKDLILDQNPMTLKWRLNGELLNKYNYKPGDTINCQIIVVDDMRNGLNITKDFSVSIEESNGINDTKITTPSTPNSRCTIDGHHLKTKPTKPGIYIVNGQKVIIK